MSAAKPDDGERFIRMTLGIRSDPPQPQREARVRSQLREEAALFELVVVDDDQGELTLLGSSESVAAFVLHVFGRARPGAEA